MYYLPYIYQTPEANLSDAQRRLLSSIDIPRMPPSSSPPSMSFLHMTDVEFLPALENCAKYKERSHNTYQNIHLPELNVRCGLGLNISEPSDLAENDPFAPKPDLGNTNPIAVVYLGNSMLERLKTTGYETQLARLSTSWNAGCGGDKNENVIYRMTSGTYRALAQPSSAPNIKLWILASGTNNLRPKAPFRPLDVESWQLLLESCLRIAPDSKVLACDMFYRKDIPDEIVDQSNEKLKEVVRGINEELVKRGMEERVMWVEVRNSIGKHMLVDNVHLNEEGYQVWDGILWPYVQDIVISKRREEGKGEEDSSYESS